MKWLALVALLSVAEGCTVKWPVDDADVAYLRTKIADLENRLAVLEKSTTDKTNQMAACLDRAEAAGDDYIKRNGGVLLTDKAGVPFWRARQVILDGSTQIRHAQTAECQALYGAK